VSADSIRSLVEPDRVHRDVYLSESLFRLEQERLFGRAWIFVGHGSMVPRPGDYLTADIGGEPVAMVRQSDGGVAVLLNRCAHKGAPVLAGRSGRVERAMRCPYHSWSYRLDGSLLAVPMREGYEGTRMRECESGAGLARVAAAQYRGFVFARLSREGVSFEEYFGEILTCIDAMADRSPAGELEAVGPPLRSLIRCNWKIYLENIPDAVHASITHESSIAATEAVWAAESEGVPGAVRPMAIEQLSPFGAGAGFVEDMGGRTLPHGHVILGTRASLHSGYSAVPEYEAAMKQAYGEERAARILSWSPQNALLYPSLAIKAAPQTMRVIRPAAVDRTVVETWAFRARQAPAPLLERTQLYNRLVFSPMSIVAHDDVHVFEGIQRALAAGGNEWVSLHRGFEAGEELSGRSATSGSSEALMRNQFRAWVRALASAPEADRRMSTAAR
jgi:phenylpropionate dioxygenase-like ring-hydroxylating dioxygenase large terminal subunit